MLLIPWIFLQYFVYDFNYIYRETFIFGDKDPPWINNVKQLILEKNKMHKSYVKEKCLIRLNFSCNIQKYYL